MFINTKLISSFINLHKYFLISSLFWFISGLLPLCSVLAEFGFNLGFKYAKFYSPLFFYPLIFGPFSVYFSLRSIKFFLFLSKSERFNLSITSLLAFILIMSISITALELSGRPAVWEVKTRAIEQTISKNTIKFKYIKSWSDFISHFEASKNTLNIDEFESKKLFLDAQKKLNTIQSEYEKVISYTSKSVKNWSITRYFYTISFFFQELALFSLFSTISFISLPKFQEILSPAKTSNLKRHYILLSFSLFFGMAWIFMRVSFDQDKLNLYGADLISTYAATPVVGFGYVLAIIYLTARLWFNYKETFQVTYNIIAASIGASLTIYSTQTGVNFLGSDATIQNYLICVIAIIIILFPWYIAYKSALDKLD